MRENYRAIEKIIVTSPNTVSPRIVVVVHVVIAVEYMYKPK